LTTDAAMPMSYRPSNQPIYVSLGIIAWNEENAIGAAIESLFRQKSFFDHLQAANKNLELICLANGCTDNTASKARDLFQKHAQLLQPLGTGFAWKVVELAERGKLNAWNQFVRHISAAEAQYLFLMDADIVVHEPETLKNMLAALETEPRASVSVDRPCKDLAFKARRSVRERVSLTASGATAAAPAQLCAQLYCIRASIARNIYLPKDLSACEDGFIKALVCTDFLKHEVLPERICVADRAAHTFEAYTSIPAILRNQKRQVIGQAIVHILVDKELPRLLLMSTHRGANEPGGTVAKNAGELADILERKDVEDPTWLKRLIAEHLRETRFFWRLYPGLLRQPFAKLKRLNFARRVLYFPVAILNSVVLFFASLAARRALKSGCTDYWPKAQRSGPAAVTSAFPETKSVHSGVIPCR
jgi:glycosyltransferase involved in cell wall biosynthesis